MKSWEDLTKAEKEKLDMYIKISTLWQPVYIVITISCLIGIMIGYALIFSLYEPFMIAGFVILLMVGFLGLVMAILMMQDKKRLYLIFGIESLTKDIFDISMEDLRKVKRVFRKVK